MSLPVVAFGPNDSYFIESPTTWGMNDLPVNLQGHFASPSPVSLVYFMLLGANESFFMTYRGVDGNDYMIHEGLPRSLDTWLSDQDENGYCTRNIPQITISLSPNGKSFFVTDGIEMGWSGFPKNLEEALETLRNPNGSWMTLPKFLTLGAHETFVLLNHDNSGAWDLRGQYPFLQTHFDKLKASATSNGLRIFHNINAIFLNPFEAGYFVLTTTKGEAAWSVPQVAKEDAIKVLGALTGPDSPSTTRSSTPPPSASVAQAQSVTKIARAELQRISSASHIPLIPPSTPPSLDEATPPMQQSPPRSHPQSNQTPREPSATQPSREFKRAPEKSVESTPQKEKSSQNSSPRSQRQTQRDTQPGQQQSPKPQHTRQRTASREIDQDQLDAATVRALASGRQLLVDIKSQIESQKASQAKTGRSTPDLNNSTGGLVNKFEELNKPVSQISNLNNQATPDATPRHNHQATASTQSVNVGSEHRRHHKSKGISSAASSNPPTSIPSLATIPLRSPSPKEEQQQQRRRRQKPEQNASFSSSPPPVAPHRTFTDESMESELRQSYASNDTSKFVAISRHARQPDNSRVSSASSPTYNL